MGLLDDAIRDHLELKRRRGADPAEVERAEREALGPVRRQPEADDPLEYPDEQVIPGDLSGQDEDDLPFEHEPAGYDREPVAHEEEPLDYGHGPEPEVGWHEPEPATPEATAPAPPQPAPDAPPGPGRDPAEPPDPGVDTKPHEAVRPNVAGPEAPPPHPAGSVAEETAEYDVEAEHAQEASREDVLEETPEFLQDTPDHDRLWFEQRPPRDFNFDG